MGNPALDSSFGNPSISPPKESFKKLFKTFLLMFEALFINVIFLHTVYIYVLLPAVIHAYMSSIGHPQTRTVLTLEFLKTLSYSFEGWCLFFCYYFIKNIFFPLTFLLLFIRLASIFFPFLVLHHSWIFSIAFLFTQIARSSSSLPCLPNISSGLKIWIPRLLLLNQVYSFLSIFIHSSVSTSSYRFSLSLSSTSSFLSSFFHFLYFNSLSLFFPIIFPSSAPTFDLNIDSIEKIITQKTRAIIIHSPNTPSGKIYSEATLVRLSVLLIILLL